MNQFYQRNFLRLLDFTSSDILNLLKFAKYLKKSKKNNKEIQYLKQKNIVLIFEKDSTRTRCSFEVAAYDQGAHVTYLGPNGNQIGSKESIKDTARILGRIYHGIQYRGYNQESLKILAEHAGIPVWNGLTNEFHPTQILADLLTMQEKLPGKPIENMKLAYVGDCSNNISNSLIEASVQMGLDLRLIGPKPFWPKANIFKECRTLYRSNSKIMLTSDINEGVEGVDFIYTDIWVSMGESKEKWNERINLLRSYQVNDAMLQLTNNPNVKFLHCLPALHDNKTELGLHIADKYLLKDGVEVSNSIFESKHSIVFDQAENRLHIIKAIMVATLAKL
ncbi:ornithine carbamoyltransferase [Candidatus Ishikawella capsulata]|uniref:Ornithine carbamoyltransferase n=1 Tax=Candidatus Ishikawaella capsulata Mpkobe TaxID=476281 RepID=C5WCU9_9ENTR|nr:ornithine carbamoyltransferase [Candidatus Ishikawaella capsulata]BAH83155.1 ornithine carbamoyltransferase 1 [Candidatus Ishikawaella capsulata Mpkobe]